MKQSLYILLASLALLFGFAPTLRAEDEALHEVLRIYEHGGNILDLHTDEIDSLFFSADGTRLLIHSHDGNHNYALSEVDSAVFMRVAHHHDEEEAIPTRIELTLASGHFHGVKFHQNAPILEQKFIKAEQHIALVMGDHGWQPAAGSDSVFRVKAGTRTVAPYGLWIKYFDAQGRDITASFVENGADSLHQHFFIPQNVRPTSDGTAEASDRSVDGIFQYYYMDTDPWNGSLNTGATLIGSKQVGSDAQRNPILESYRALGLKGWFNFQKARKQFDLNVRLMHAAESKYINGKCSPFNKPTPGQLAGNHWDVNFSVPVIVFSDQYEDALWTSEPAEHWSTDAQGNEIVTYDELQFDDLTPAEQKLVRSIAAAHGCTLREAIYDVVMQIKGTSSPESGKLWF